MENSSPKTNDKTFTGYADFPGPAFGRNQKKSNHEIRERHENKHTKGISAPSSHHHGDSSGAIRAVGRFRIFLSRLSWFKPRHRIKFSPTDDDPLIARVSISFQELYT
jgi:hypothetical protein